MVNQKITAMALTCTVVFSTILSSTTPSKAAISDMVFGDILEQFSTRLERAMEKAEASGLRVLIQGGIETKLVIENAKLAYKDSLNLTQNAFNSSIRSSISTIEGAILEIENQSVNDLSRLIEDLQTAISIMPFRQSDPRVSRFRPTYIAPSTAEYNLQVKINGNFIFASKKGFKPHLEVNGKQVGSLVGNTDQELTFEISPSIVVNKQKAGFSYASLTLVAPYEQDTWLWFKEKKTSEFKLYIGTLPPSPGKLTLSHRTVREVEDVSTSTDTRTFRVPAVGSWSQHSSHNDIPNNPQRDLNEWCSEPIPPDYTLNPESLRFVVDWSQGRLQTGGNNWDWRYSLTRTSPSVCFGVATIKRTLGTSGKVNFHFEYTASKTTTVATRRNEYTWTSEPLNLMWGQVIDNPYEIGNWELKFDAIDGVSHQIRGNFSNPFIQIKDQGGSFRIKASDPGSLQWP